MEGRGHMAFFLLFFHAWQHRAAGSWAGEGFPAGVAMGIWGVMSWGGCGDMPRGVSWLGHLSWDTWRLQSTLGGLFGSEMELGRAG